MHIVLRDGTAYAVHIGNLPPGQKGQHTNGPPSYWLRTERGDWRIVPNHHELKRGRFAHIDLLQLAQVCDTQGEFEQMLWQKEGLEDK
jgi:hypothetical protein